MAEDRKRPVPGELPAEVQADLRRRLEASRVHGDEKTITHLRAECRECHETVTEVFDPPVPYKREILMQFVCELVCVQCRAKKLGALRVS